MMHIIPNIHFKKSNCNTVMLLTGAMNCNITAPIKNTDEIITRV